MLRRRTGSLLLAGLAAALLTSPLPAPAGATSSGTTTTTTTTTTGTAGWTFERVRNLTHTLVREERGALIAT